MRSITTGAQRVVGEPSMELRQIEYFVAVAEERHFTRAAARMHVAQSGLSASIRALERDLGAALFVRSTRRVELTEAGRALLAEARRTLHTVTAAREAVAAVQGLLRGNLAVGTIQCLGGIDLPRALGRFRTAHPGVRIALRQGSSPELIDEVRGGALDLAFVSSPPDGSAAGVRLTPLEQQPMVVACAPGHPLAAAGAVALAELDTETYVDFAPGWVTRDVTDHALRLAGLSRRVALTVNDVHTLLDLVAQGLGVALVPESFRHKQTGARFVPVAGTAPVWRTAVATTADRDPSAATRAFLAAERLALPVDAVP
jgi:DNA-binding transcriptional LysR family regulator